MESLEHLDFSSHLDINDTFIQAVSTLKLLSNLNISECMHIKDISLLEKLPNLRVLDTSKTKIEKFFKKSESLILWCCGENTARFFGEFKDEIELPSLQQLSIIEDNTFTEDSFVFISRLPSILDVNLSACNISINWIHLLIKSKSLSFVNITNSPELEEYKKKHNLLESYEIEKMCVKNLVENQGKEFKLEKTLSEFSEYVKEYTVFIKEKLFQFYNKTIKMVEDFISVHGFDRKHFALSLANNRLKGILFGIFGSFNKNVSVDKEALYVHFRKLLKSDINSNWVSIRSRIFEDKKIIDFIPIKYHKQYMSIETFLNKVWKVNYTNKKLILERTFQSTYPALYFLLVLKRANVFIPKRLVQYVLKYIL